MLNPASLLGILWALVALLTHTLTETIDKAVLKGLEQLHCDLQAQRISQTMNQVSSMENKITAQAITQHWSAIRPVIVRYLNYTDKNSILHRFQCSHNISIGDYDLLLFADYSIEVNDSSRLCTATTSSSSWPILICCTFTLQWGECVSFTPLSEVEHY